MNNTNIKIKNERKKMETVKIVLIGKITNIIENEDYNRLQFLTKKDNGTLDFVNVKVPSNEKFKEGEEVKLLVNIGVFNNKPYFKYVGKLK